MTLVSFLIPTRHRPFGAQAALDSILSTAADPSRVEVLFVMDEDDPESQEWAKTVAHIPQAHCFVTPRIGNGYEHLFHYYNLLAEQANGDFLFIFNDDTTMLSQGWDSVIAKFEGQCVLLNPKWTYEAPYATFPIVSRKFYERMGMLCEHVYIDRYLSFIAKEAGVFVDAKEGEYHIELDHVGDTDRRINGNNGKFKQLVRVQDYFTPPDIIPARITELANMVRNG